VDVPPAFTGFDSEAVVATVGSSSVFINPLGVSGGAITACSVTPALPAGLSLSDQCQITGTPIAPSFSQSFLVTASNSGGEVSQDLSIEVMDVAPILVPPGANVQLIRGVAATSGALSLGNPGGGILQCSISPSLPSGLALGSDCSLSGTPAVLSAAQSFSVTATNTGGSSSVTLNLAVSDALPAIQYLGGSQIYQKGTAVSALTPRSTGGVLDGCSVSPLLPSGLALSPACRITGTPSVVSAGRDYTVIGSNSAGNASTTVRIQVKDRAPILDYSGHTSYIFLTGGSSVTATPRTDLGGAITACSVNPALPAGLALSDGCVISGTASATAAEAPFALTASNSGGSSTITLRIRVSEVAPALSFSPSNHLLKVGVAMATLTPTNIGGPVRSCAADPALPTGLFLSSNCVIGGTPASLSAARNYSITPANNAGAGSRKTISIQVDYPPLALSYPNTILSFTQGSLISSQTPALTGGNGGAVTACSASPPLPAGLSLSPTACVLSGTPSTGQAQTVHTITATGQGGPAQATLTVTVQELPPAISYSPATVTLSPGQNFSRTVTSTGGAITGCSSVPAPPAGISVGPDCTISGASVTPLTMGLLVTAANAGGVSSAAFSITVSEVAPDISYAGTPFVAVKNQALAPISVLNAGGVISSCVITPALPTGLSFNATTCRISGTPTAVRQPSIHVVTASNSGGVDNFAISLEVQDTAPVISFPQSPLTLVQGVAISTPIAPSNSGAPTLSCNIISGMPAGLSADSGCQITGTATTPQASSPLVVEAVGQNGSSQATLSLQVLAPPPALSLTPASKTFIRGQAITPFQPSNGGGPIGACAVNVSLPPGLSLDLTNCGISGSPTVLQIPASYRLTATNPAGSSNLDITIEVVDDVPAFSYSPASLILTRGQGISPIVPNSTGGAVTACSANAAMPAGLVLGADCRITGTPSATGAPQTYTVTGTNPTGQQIATLELQVVEPAPAIVYSPSTRTFMKGSAVTPFLPVSSAGPVSTCTLGGTLPAGLVFNGANCEISGTPSGVSLLQSYLVTATNSGGSAQTTLSLRVNDIAPAIDFPASPVVLQLGQSVNIAAPTNSGGGIDSCSPVTALPSGLSVHPTTCAISGTAMATQAPADFTVTAANTGGTSSDAINIEVRLASPSIAFAPDSRTLILNQALTAFFPLNGGGAATSCSISPALPAGIAFDSVNCGLSGTPTAANSMTAYTVTAQNGGGNSQTTLNLEVAEFPPVISYAQGAHVFSRNSPIAAVTVISTGGPISGCAINPALPAGLSISSACTLSGTPTVSQGVNLHTITATGPGGSGQATLTVTVNDQAPLIVYSPNSVSLTRNTPIGGAGIAAQSLGGAMTQCSILPALPSGLSISSSCLITGTPSAISPSTVYTVTASNSGGQGSTSLGLEVDDIVPAISYASGVLTYVVGDTISVTAPTNSGGAITACQSAPSLPAGFTLDPLTCAITGNAVTEVVTGNFVVTASNSGGSSSETLSVTVNTSAPSIVFSPPSRTLQLNQAITAFYPLNTGSAATACSISQALPAGLSFNTTNCGISGTPTAVSASVSYTISATNSGGSDSTVLSLAVADLPPVMAYAPDSRVLTKGSATNFSVLSTGGPISTCTSSVPLPAGLTLANNCTISGTPSAVAAAAAYTITAAGSGGNGTANLVLTVNDLPPAVSYSPASQTMAINTVIGGGGYTITNTGGAITQCTVAPALPVGLSINSGCTISGTPTGVSSVANYSVTATNTGGSSATTLALQVNDVAPGIDYPAAPFVFTVGQAVNISAPTRTGGAITGCQSAAPLPAGMILNTSTCAITGTALSEAVSSGYSVTASNSGGSGSDTVTLAVNLSAPSISFSPGSRILALNQAVTTIFPLNAGGGAASCTISPALPAGLSFNTTNCGISGTPSALSSSTSYTITATNSGGSSGNTLSITVADLPPVIAFSPNSQVFTKGTVAAMSVVSSGGAYSSCAIAPALPAGLTINNGCAIGGTASVVSAATSYTVTATGTGGVATALIVLTVNDIAPQISYSPAVLIQTVNTAVGGGGKVVTNLGGAITQCAVAPALPAGLSLSSACTVSGTPTVISTSSNYSVTATNSGGSYSTGLNVEIRDVPPNITFGAGSYSFVQDADITEVVANNTGGGIIQCNSNPLMPAGLNLADDCTISGRPADPMASTNFTITASNSGGTSSRTLAISIDVGVPNIYFAPSARILGVSLPAQSMIPNNTGGAVTSCQVTGTVPAGLTVSNACMVSGTPTAVGGPWTLFLLASNAKGQAAEPAELTITVNDIPPVLTYAQTSFLLTRNTPISAISPTLSGGTLSICSVSPALPAGLIINPGTCVISGTPTEYSAQQTYLVSASNGTGSSLENLTIRVNDILPAISYAPATLNFLVGAAIAAPVVTNTGGAIIGCSVTPALPSGLSLNSQCQLSGTPTVVAAQATYTVQPVNSGGTGSATFLLTVQQQAPNITYFPLSFTFSVGGAINSVVPFSTGGSITSCTVDIPLPAGLVLGNNNCVISGTPSVAVGSANYTITATNTTGSSVKTISILVASGPPILSYGSTPLNLTANIAMSPVTPVNSGGAATACNVDQSLPLGIQLSSDCRLTGTPMAPAAATLYTITGANSYGIGSAQLTISVASGPPALSFGVSTYVFTQNVPITPFAPNNSGGAVTTCASTPALPAGLTISNNCVMTGTPSGVTGATNFSVQATNTAGSDSTTISITVNPGAPVISFADSYRAETLRSPVSGFGPLNSGGAITGCGVTPALPSGITFNQQCQISGTPSVISPQKTYTVTASNASGSSAASFDLKVRNLPVLAYQSKLNPNGLESATASSSWNVWSMTYDGVEKLPLTMATAGSHNSTAPTFATDGTLYFNSTLAQAYPVSWTAAQRLASDLWSVLLDGSSLTFRTSGNNAATFVVTDPVYGEVGGTGKIAFASRAAVSGVLTAAVTTHLNVFMMNPDGSGVVALTTNTGTGTNTRDSREPTWAPSGSAVYYTSEATLAGAAQVCFSLHQALTANPYTKTILVSCGNVAGKDIFDPAVSPDGTKILYHSMMNVGVTASASHNIFVYDIALNVSTALTTNTVAGRDSTRARWSPDGSEIVFLSKMNVNAAVASSANVWKMSADGSSQVALTGNNAAALDADRAFFSPDGNTIAFSSKQPVTGSTASASFNIWVMNSDGTNEVARTAITTTAAKDSQFGRGDVWYVEP
jgi:hypothetical protein